MRNSTGGVCCTKLASEKRKGHLPIIVFFFGGGGCFSFGGTVQYIEESNIYLCFVVCRLKRGLVT